MPVSGSRLCRTNSTVRRAVNGICDGIFVDAEVSVRYFIQCVLVPCTDKSSTVFVKDSVPPWRDEQAQPIGGGGGVGS
jgi:hypothetical protein